eukprot:15468643-Alexandrium_andersonii.AAC.1
MSGHQDQHAIQYRRALCFIGAALSLQLEGLENQDVVIVEATHCPPPLWLLAFFKSLPGLPRTPRQCAFPASAGNPLATMEFDLSAEEGADAAMGVSSNGVGEQAQTQPQAKSKASTRAPSTTAGDVCCSVCTEPKVSGRFCKIHKKGYECIYRHAMSTEGRARLSCPDKSCVFDSSTCVAIHFPCSRLPVWDGVPFHWPSISYPPLRPGPCHKQCLRVRLCKCRWKYCCLDVSLARLSAYLIKVAGRTARPPGPARSWKVQTFIGSCKCSETNTSAARPSAMSRWRI